VVTPLHEKEGSTQVATLIYAEDILISLSLTEDELKDYSVVKAKLEGHFVRKRNVVFERSRLINDARKKVRLLTRSLRHCLHLSNIADSDELIRDRIVVDIRDPRLSEKMQLDNTLADTRESYHTSTTVRGC
jgi:hypothetical protein